MFFSVPVTLIGKVQGDNIKTRNALHFHALSLTWKAEAFTPPLQTLRKRQFEQGEYAHAGASTHKDARCVLQQQTHSK